jgi:hypothetical protein
MAQSLNFSTTVKAFSESVVDPGYTQYTAHLQL